MELFAERGYDGTSMGEIAQAGGDTSAALAEALKAEMPREVVVERPWELTWIGLERVAAGESGQPG